MTLKIADITSYLASTGWERGPETWNGAPVWLRSGDFAVLVPPRDGLGDGTARVREILRCLSAAEQRSEAQIADEIAAPLADVQEYRAFPSGHATGYIPLAAGTAMIQGIERLVRASARVVADGPHVRFTGQPPPGVRRVLRAAELGPARPGSFVLRVRIPVAGVGEPSGRRVLTQLAEATGAARTALDSGSVQAFDHTVTSGVSADFCAALSDIAGRDRQDGLEISFRWARGAPASQPPGSVSFPAGSSAVLSAAATRLRRLAVRGELTAAGSVESLHDDPSRGDRWRVKVRGERAVWVRLPDQRTYDLAMVAHRARVTVRATGELTSVNGRVELVTGVHGFDVVEPGPASAQPEGRTDRAGDE